MLFIVQLLWVGIVHQLEQDICVSGQHQVVQDVGAV